MCRRQKRSTCLFKYILFLTANGAKNKSAPQVIFYLQVRRVRKNMKEKSNTQTTQTDRQSDGPLTCRGLTDLLCLWIERRKTETHQ